jgi:hypothetical protein
MSAHNTIPASDHEEPKHSGLIAHLTADHGRHPAIVYAMREWERVENHNALHAAMAEKDARVKP